MAANGTATDADNGFADFKLYRYTPSLPAAIIAAGVFGLLTALHAWRMAKARSWYFTAFTIGGLFQTIGYIGRIISHFDPESLSGFIIQAILILVAPALYAASIYMILGRIIICLHAEHLSIVRPRWMTRVFVLGDVISFTMQSGGGGIQSAGSLDMFNLGEKIIVGGLFAQILIFGFFVATAGVFHVRILRQPTDRSERNMIPWRKDLAVLYTVSGLILVRSIFRVVEYLQGNDGYLISHEIFLYIFDAVLMALVMVIFLVHYVGHLDVKDRYKEGRELIESVELRESLDMPTRGPERYGV